MKKLDLFPTPIWLIKLNDDETNRLNLIYEAYKLQENDRINDLNLVKSKLFIMSGVCFNVSVRLATITPFFALNKNVFFSVAIMLLSFYFQTQL